MGHWRALSITLAVACVAFTALMLFAQPAHHAAANPIGGLKSISAGEGMSCAVTTSGGVKCWGQTATTRSAVPIDVANYSSGVEQVAVGSGFACALSSGGGASCWGDNSFGQLGGIASGGAQVSAGYQYACAVLTSGGVECWGANDYGQLGDGSTAEATSAVDVVGLSGPAAAVSAAYQHTCAVTAAGAAQCWGRNDYGQLGDGTSISRLTATNVSGLGSDVIAIASSLNASCAVVSNGAVTCWGLGYGSTPRVLNGVSDAVAIDGGFTHFCALTSSGGVSCWGTNGDGELGDGLACGTRCSVPVSALLSGAASVTAGVFHTCALMADGGAKCWGINGSGQIGNGSSDFQVTAPVDVAEHDVKPTPTPTPCDPGGCPSPTPVPGLPQTGIDFSISIDANGDGIAECGTGAGQSTECSLAPNSAFQVVLTLNALPEGVARYAGYDVYLEFAGVNVRMTWMPLWPDCVLPAQDFSFAFPYPSIVFPSLAVGCAAGRGADSTYGGPMAAIDFTCSGTGSIAMGHSRDGAGHVLEADIATQDLRLFWQFHDTQPSISVNCGPLQRGDTNCNRSVNAIDAQLMLQYGAGLDKRLGCPQQSDVNLDGQTNAIDASLTLQYDATLIDTLPPNQRPR